ncbi:MAG: hypothetical protein WAT81_05170 [Candidatus Moraniibacteriota bacterium]
MEDFHAVGNNLRKQRITRVVLGVLTIFLMVISGTIYLSKREIRRNAERLEDIQAITIALHQYAALHEEAYPAGLDGCVRQIGSATRDCQISTAQCMISETTDCIDLAPVLSPYLKEMPYDPGSGSSERTHYAVQSERGGGFLVIPCDYSE